MSWTLLGLRDLSTAIHRQPHSCDLRISLGWKDSDTSDSIARHLEGFQQLSRYLSWTRGWWQSVTGEQLQHCSLFAITEHSTQTGQPFSPRCGAPHIPGAPFATPNAYSGVAVITLLSACLMTKPVHLPRSPMNLCRCSSWKLVLSSKGLVPSHSGSPLSPITPQDFTSDPVKRRCSQESWLGLTLRKRQKFPVLPLLYRSCVSPFSFSSCFY